MREFLNVARRYLPLLLLALLLGGAFALPGLAGEPGDAAADPAAALVDQLPPFSPDHPFVELDGNVPHFSDDEKSMAFGFEMYGDLDRLGRCTAAFAGIGPETLAWGERGAISDVVPSGWRSDVYDFVDGGALFNRCHLVAYVLSGESANERNLVTGTRWLNTQGMQPFESQIATYVDRTGNHVLYRVTPVFVGDELVCRGVRLEGWSVEDGGEGVCFDVFAYNCQPGVAIDYATGDNWADGSMAEPAASPAEADAGWSLPAGAAAASVAGIAAGEGARGSSDDPDGGPAPDPDAQEYVLNTNTHKFHYPWCASVEDMKEKNKRFTTETRDEIIAQGYAPCKRCNP